MRAFELYAPNAINRKEEGKNEAAAALHHEREIVFSGPPYSQ